MIIPYWIDAICINQADDEEKTLQIKLMNTIYRQADKVLVWLGEALTQEQQDLIPRAIELLPLLVKEHARYRLSTAGPYFEVAPELSHLGRDGWEAILHLVRNTYFWRVWVVQEVALAKGVMFLCGDHEISLQLMEEAVVDSWNLRNWAIYDLTNGQRMRVQAPSHDDSVVFKIRHIVQPDHKDYNTEGNAHQTIRIANLLDNQTCFAPQDRVLGILGMVQEEFEGAGRELHRYTSIPHLYTRFSTLLFTASGPSITDLHWWFYLSMAFNLKRIDGLPSWVPDLHHNDSKCKRQPYESMLAARVYSDPPWQASSRPCIVSKGSRSDEIILRGKLLDTVLLVHPEVPHFPGDSEPGYGDGMTWLRVMTDVIQWERKLADAVLYHPPSQSTRAASEEPVYSGISEDTYWRTLLADARVDFTGNKKFTRETWLLFREAGQRMLVLVPRLEELRKTTGRDPWTLPDWASSEQETQTMHSFRGPGQPVGSFAAVLCFTRHHQLFGTEHGRLGFTATGVQRGDVVCVFNHAVSPHVLRRVRDRDGAARYRFVGDAYVHGLMYGESDDLDVEERDIVLV
ncbi:hypothetical protein ST47_g7943 [Ascochyta rabiei]|uniref:Heterokaryon incompatibility domain-containing protein n=2 Tax=Didymella rabiei TaxID=5454 RepID=A0A162ZZY2_DIDRA|nr:hypothetical protein ST47_g7943 [Ascochyta rabiei]